MGEPPEFIGDNREQVELDLMQKTDTSESGAQWLGGRSCASWALPAAWSPRRGTSSSAASR